jgi:hypothetical protein
MELLVEIIPQYESHPRPVELIQKDWVDDVPEPVAQLNHGLVRVRVQLFNFLQKELPPLLLQEFGEVALDFL